MGYVPVFSKENKPLMPTTSSRARRKIKSGKATPFFKMGIFCIRLNFPSGEAVQPIVVGVDPGSKREAMSGKSASHTYFNIQSDAITHVKEKIEKRRNMRRSRRFRNTPCRKPRWANRSASRRKDRIPPSTKARYDLKLSICKNLSNIYPISGFVVEDLKAESRKGKSNKKWNGSFSPLQCGKEYFYNRLRELRPTVVRSGRHTAQLRKSLGLSKTDKKMSDQFAAHCVDSWSDQFAAHCVDSWALANSATGGHRLPDNEEMLLLYPIKSVRRQLHYFQHRKGGKRSRFGGTMSLGFKKESIVKYMGKTKGRLINGNYYLIGGNDGKNLTLCSLLFKTNEKGTRSKVRVNFSVNPKDCKFVTYNKFAYNYINGADNDQRQNRS